MSRRYTRAKILGGGGANAPAGDAINARLPWCDDNTNKSAVACRCMIEGDGDGRVMNPDGPGLCSCIRPTRTAQPLQRAPYYDFLEQYQQEAKQIDEN